MAELERLLVRVDASVEGLRKGLAQADKAVSDTEKRINRSTENIDRRLKQVGAAFAGFLTVHTAREISRTGLAFDRVGIALKAATGTAEGAKREFAFLQKETNRLGLNTLETAQSYGKLLSAARGTSLEGQKVRDIFIAIAEASSVMGLSTEDTAGAVRALEQMISKGKISSEELRLQLGDRIPGAMKIAASAMGVTTLELDKMLKEGKVFSEDFLPKFAAKLKEQFAGGVSDAAESARASFQRLQNTFQEVERNISVGLNEGLAKSADIISDAFDTVAVKEFAAVIGDLAGTEISALVFVLEKLARVAIVPFTLMAGALEAVRLGSANATIEVQKLLGVIDADVAAEATKGLQGDMDRLTRMYKGLLGDAGQLNQTVADLPKGKKAITPLGDLSDDAEKAAKNAERLKEALDDMQREANLDLLKTGDDEITQAMYDIDFAVAKLVERFGKLNEQQLKQVETIKAAVRETKQWEVAEKARAEAQEEADRKREQAQERLKDELARPFENAAENIQNLFSDTFEGIFDGSIDSAQDAADAMKKIFIRLAAEMATLAIFRPEVLAAGGVGGLASGIFSGGSSAGGGLPFGSDSLISGIIGKPGIADAIDSFGATALPSLFGAAAVPSVLTAEVGAGLAGVAAPSILATEIGAGLTGAAAPTILATEIGAGLTGAGAGGAAGAGALSGAGIGLSTIALPVAALVATALISGVFKKSRPHPASTFSFGGVGDNGKLQDLDIRAKHIGEETARGFSDAISQSLTALQQIGLKFGGLAPVQGGVDDGRGFLKIGDKTIGFNPQDEDDAQRAISDLILTITQSADNASQVFSDEATAALSRIETHGRDLQAVMSDVAFAAGFDALLKMPEELSQVEQAVKDLDATFDGIRATADRLGLSLDKVNAAEQVRLDKLRSQFTGDLTLSLLEGMAPNIRQLAEEEKRFLGQLKDAAALGLGQDTIARINTLHQKNVELLTKGAEQTQDIAQNAQNMVSRFGSVSEKFKKLLFDLQFGQLSPLNPRQRLDALRGQVGDLGRRARLGDVDAADELAELLPEFVQLSAEFNGFNKNFESDRAMAEDLARATKSVADRQLEIQKRILDEAGKQTGLLGILAGGSSSAGNANDKIYSLVQSGKLSTESAHAIIRAAGFTGTIGGGNVQRAFDADPAMNQRAWALLKSAGFASGGMVTGGIKGVDSVPAMLSPGEVVMRARAVQAIGANTLLAANQTGRLANDNVRGVEQRLDKLTNVVLALVNVTAASGNQTVAGLHGVQAELSDISNKARLEAAK